MKLNKVVEGFAVASFFDTHATIVKHSCSGPWSILSPINPDRVPAIL